MKTKTRTATMVAGCMMLVAASVHADVTRDESGWSCGAIEDWEFATVKVAPKVALNNFFFEEDNGFMTSMETLDVRYSAINRQDRSFHMTAQFAGFDEAGGLTFAMSVNPGFDTIGDGTETVSDDVYIDGPVLERTARICARFTGQLAK